MYKAKIDIGDFKKGQIVPDDIAAVWKGMYLESPVIEIKEEAKKVVEPQKPIIAEPKKEPIREEKKKSMRIK